MNFSIVFKNTGDFIPFVSVNTPVLEYFVDQLKQNNLNEFVLIDSHRTRIAQLELKITNAQSVIEKVNSWLHDLIDCQIGPYDFEDYFDQNILNKVHADWVNSQQITYDIDKKRKQFNYQGLAEQIHNMYPDSIRFPKLGDVLLKLDYRTLYNLVNESCHNIEDSFNNFLFITKNSNWNEFKNPFDHSLLTNDIANLRISFAHLGRCLYNKFQHFDMHLEYKDENTFNQLLNFVTLGFSQPQTIPLSKEYINWCNQHNKFPSGEHLNIGNIPDLAEKIKDYRLIVYRNTKQNNQFFINL